MLLSAQFGLFRYLLNFVYKSSSLFPLHDGSITSRKVDFRARTRDP